MKKTILITGGAGYVGAMLCDQFARRDDIETIIAIDKEPETDLTLNNPNKNKIIYIQSNLSDEVVESVRIGDVVDTLAHDGKLHNHLNKSDKIREELSHTDPSKAVEVADTWESVVAKYKPSIVIHTAWQIREIYGDRPLSYKWNIDGSDRVFDYVFNFKNKHSDNKYNQAEKLVYFSTVSSYGAFADNSVDYFFKETDKFRETKYLYAEEKRWAEQHLEKKYAHYIDTIKSESSANVHTDGDSKNNETTASDSSKDNKVQVFILRPAAITGPRGRYDRIRFGLQSALAGNLDKSFVNRIVTALTSFVPVTPKWLRQFIHEDDVADIVELLALHDDVKGVYEVFNICPPGETVRGADMAKAVGKSMIMIHPYMARAAFFVLWHLSRGKIPTGEGAWKGYSYPIAVTGEKLTDQYGYVYKYKSKDAFKNNEGRYKVILNK